MHHHNSVRSVKRMGKPRKCPRRCADIKGRVYLRVKYTQRMRGNGDEASKEGEFGCKMSRTSAPQWCNSIMPAARWSRRFTVLRNPPKLLCSLCIWPLSENLLNADIKRSSPPLTYTWIINHTDVWSLSYPVERALCGVLSVQSLRQHLHVKTSVKFLRRTMSSNSSSRRQNEDSPRLDRVWVSRAGSVPCRFSSCLCKKGKAGMKKREEPNSTRKNSAMI